MELTKKVFSGWIAVVFFFFSSNILLAKDSKKSSGVTLSSLSLLGSLGEAAGGGALILTGVGTVPGVIILAKGAADTVVSVRNIMRAMNGEKLGAQSAIGELAGLIGDARGTDPAKSRHLGDTIDMFASAATLVVAPAMTGRVILSSTSNAKYLRPAILGGFFGGTVKGMTDAQSNAGN